MKHKISIYLILLPLVGTFLTLNSWAQDHRLEELEIKINAQNEIIKIVHNLEENKEAQNYSNYFIKLEYLKNISTIDDYFF